MIAPALDAQKQLADPDDLVGALLGTREANLRTPAAKARHAGVAYDTERLHRFEVLRAELAKRDFAERPEPADPGRLFAFF